MACIPFLDVNVHTFLLLLTNENPETGQFHFLLLGLSPCTYTGVKDPDVGVNGVVIVIWILGSVSIENAREG